MTNPNPDPIEPVYGPEVHSPKLVSEAVLRKFVSRNGFGYLAIGIIDAAGNPVDPDGGAVSLTLWFDDLSGLNTDIRGTQIVSCDQTNGIVRQEVGKFHYDITPTFTGTKGLINAEWSYAVGGQPITFADHMQILDPMPTYDRLTADSKVIVEQSSWYFADLFDSTEGGPWLQENFQTHFNYERIAFLMGQAVMKFNVTGFPVTYYGVSVGDNPVPDNMQQFTIWATKLEIIRHLIVSYTEQPTFTNMTTTYTDRRDYAQRWQAVLQGEEAAFNKAAIMSKRALLKLGRGSLLVGGGIFGGTARGIFMSGMYSAQARAGRFYPAAPSVMFASQAFGR